MIFFVRTSVVLGSLKQGCMCSKRAGYLLIHKGVFPSPHIRSRCVSALYHRTCVCMIKLKRASFVMKHRFAPSFLKYILPRIWNCLLLILHVGFWWWERHHPWVSALLENIFVQILSHLFLLELDLMDIDRNLLLLGSYLNRSNVVSLGRSIRHILR